MWQARSLTTKGTPRKGPSAGSVCERLLEQRVDDRVQLAVQRLHAPDRGLRRAPAATPPRSALARPVRWRPAGGPWRRQPTVIARFAETGSGFASFWRPGLTRSGGLQSPWNRYRLSQGQRCAAGQAGCFRKGQEGLARKSRGLRERARARDPDPRARVRRLRQRGRAVPRRQDRRGRVHQVPPPPGRLRPAPGRRADDPGEAALRWHHARADGDLRGGGGALGPAQQGPHHHAAEHPAAPHPAARRRRGDPRARRCRPVLARGLRQHRPQRDRRPLGRHLRGRALRPHALRGRLRALLRAPPHHPADAAQGEDGLHRHRRGPRDHRHPRRGLHPARAEGRAARVRDARGRRHFDHAARRADA